jgi:hypothetical protein
VPLAELAAHRGNMCRITELRLVCRQCGSRAYKAFLFLNAHQAEAFAAGKSYADIWDLRHAGLAADDPRVIYWTNPNSYRTTLTEPGASVPDP